MAGILKILNNKMKKIISTIIICLIFISSKATNYYVSPTGSDSNPGTIGAPFRTWAKGTNNGAGRNPGDTIFIRGGTYTSPVAANVQDWLVTFANLHGTSGSHIVITNYPGEFPILDLTGFVQSRNTTALRINECDWVDIYGLKIQNLAQNSSFASAGIDVHASLNMKFERVWVHNIGGAGWRQAQMNGSDTRKNDNFTYVNCDASFCADPTSTGGGNYGNADGFDTNEGTTAYINCRAWWNSDDGFDFSFNDSTVTIDTCWSFRNGYVPGTFNNPGPQADGMGFKWAISSNADRSSTTTRFFTKCIAFDNKAAAYDQNAGKVKAQFYNCDAFRCPNGWQTGWSLSPLVAHILTNNVAFQVQVPVTVTTSLVMTTNSWQLSTPTSASFSSTDTSGVTGARGINGALPVLQFLHLSSTSNLLNVGTDVGLQFCGTKPDLGAYEFCSASGTLTATATAPPISCFNSTTTVTVNATGGVTPYQYRITTGSFSNTNTFPNLAPGTYSFEVKDALGAIATASITISQPSAIVISQSSGTISVNGGSTSTTVTASGGTGTLQYKLDSRAYQTSNVFTNVTAGNHTITVLDANLCTNTINYTLTQPSVLVVSAAATTNPLTCFNNTTTITVTATGGTTPYSYQINGGTSQSSNLFTSRGAGTYTLTVTDAGGAVQTTTVTITQPTQIIITQSSGTISVNGGTTSTTVTASGGTGTLNYSLDGGAYQASNVFSGVAAGTHTITVRDANSCTNTLTYTLTQPSALVISAAATTNPLTCFGNTTTITVTASGGTSPYTYSINGGTSQSSNLFTGRGAGTYTLTVVDAASVSKTTTVTITQPTQITITESHTTIAVNGGSSTVSITASGGTGSKTYSMDGGTFQASNSFSVLAGNHTITVKDANSCTNTLTFSVTQPTALVVSAATTTAISCNGGSGVITVTASGGTSPYQYKVGTGAYQSSNLFTVTVGTYTFTVLDAGGAVVSTNATITQPTIISISISTSGSTVTVTSGGGVGQLNYQLDGGAFQTSNVFTGVSSGNHTMIVRDANLCTQTKTFNVGTPLRITISYTAIRCSGGTTTVNVNATGGTVPYNGTGAFVRGVGTWTFSVNDAINARADTTIVITQPAVISVSESHSTISVNGGTSTVTVTASGGTGTLQYAVDNSGYQLSNVFSSIVAGNHIISVHDVLNCVVKKSFTISQPGVLGISLSAVPAISCNGGTTTVTASGSGGTPPYSFLLDNIRSSSTGVFTLVSAGTHTVSVTDAFTNRKDTIITISQPSALVLSVTTGTIAVNGGTTTVTASGSGGTGGLTYSLDGGVYQGSGSFSGVAAGSHTVTLKDANSCTTSNTFTISQPNPTVIIGLSLDNTIDCYGGTVTATVSGTMGTTPYTYGKNGVFQTSNTFSGVTAGTYTFSVRDAFGFHDDTIVTISQASPIVVAVSTGTISVNGGTTTVTASASGGTGGLQYKLDGGSYQGTGSFSGVSAGLHTVTVKDANNCTQTNNFSITQPGTLYITATPTLSSLSCYGDVTTVTVSGSGGTTPYTYGKNGAFQGSGTFSDVTAGTYTFSVRDAFSAQHDTIITITQPTQIRVTSIVIGTLPNISGTAPVVVTISGGTPVNDSLYSFQIDGGGYTLGTDGFTYTFATVAVGNHTITIKDANDCVISYQFNMPKPRGKKNINHIYVNGSP